MALSTPGGTRAAGKGSFGELEIATGAITSGVYTPTLTNGTNVDASTAYECQYLRVGNVVTVSGRIDIDATAAGSANVDISLPIASNFGSGEDCAGVINGSAAGTEGGYVEADVVNNRAELWPFPATSSNQAFRFVFTYQVI